jgi:hypothetical protein
MNPAFFAFNNPFTMGLHRQYIIIPKRTIRQPNKTTINNNKRIIKPEWNDDGKGNLTSDK